LSRFFPVIKQAIYFNFPKKKSDKEQDNNKGKWGTWRRAIREERNVPCRQKEETEQEHWLLNNSASLVFSVYLPFASLPLFIFLYPLAFFLLKGELRESQGTTAVVALLVWRNWFVFVFKKKLIFFIFYFKLIFFNIFKNNISSHNLIIKCIWYISVYIRVLVSNYLRFCLFVEK